LGSVAFSAGIQQAINPGLSAAFAWLANQAIMYQEYKFSKLRFLYETEKGSSTNGKVMIAFQQDSTDAAPASKQEMLENQFKAGGATWQPFALTVPMNKMFALGKSRYIRGGTLAADLDQKTYDIGQLIVATQGMADATAVGELYIEYDVELMTPIQNMQALTSIMSKVFTAVTPADASLLGTTPTSVGNLDVTATVNTLTFNRVGRYLITCMLDGTGCFTSYVPVVSNSTATVALVSGGISNAAANVGTSAAFAATVIVTAKGQTAVIETTTQNTNVTAAVLRVSAFSST